MHEIHVYLKPISTNISNHLLIMSSIIKIGNLLLLLPVILLASCMSRTSQFDLTDPTVAGIRISSGLTDYLPEDENFEFIITVSSQIAPALLEIEFEDRSFGARTTVFQEIFPRNLENFEFIAAPEANAYLLEYEFPIEEELRRGTSYDVKATLLAQDNQTYESNVIRISVAD
jgi:hypothetical protein